MNPTFRLACWLAKSSLVLRMQSTKDGHLKGFLLRQIAQLDAIAKPRMGA